AIAPMMQALEVQDYVTFYFVNSEFGLARGLAFDAAIAAFSAYIDKHEAEFFTAADDEFIQALTAIGIGIFVGLLLMIAVRIVFGRTVIRPLREAGTHFDRIAEGDLTQRVSVTSRNEIGLLFDAL